MLSVASLFHVLHCFPQKIQREGIHLAFRLMNQHPNLPGKALQKQFDNYFSPPLYLLIEANARTHTHTHLLTSFTLSFPPLVCPTLGECYFAEMPTKNFEYIFEGSIVFHISIFFQVRYCHISVKST